MCHCLQAPRTHRDLAPASPAPPSCTHHSLAACPAPATGLPELPDTHTLRTAHGHQGCLPAGSALCSGSAQHRCLAAARRRCCTASGSPSPGQRWQEGSERGRSLLAARLQAERTPHCSPGHTSPPEPVLWALCPLVLSAQPPLQRAKGCAHLRQGRQEGSSEAWKGAENPREETSAQKREAEPGPSVQSKAQARLRREPETQGRGKTR